MAKKFLVKHVGNLGDLVFLAPPILATLKETYPDCEITFVTGWGFRQKLWAWHFKRLSWDYVWGKREFSGAGIALMMTNPHIDHLVHWHDTKLSLAGEICQEDDQSFPTWSAAYYTAQKNKGDFDGVYEIDQGLSPRENPLEQLYAQIGLPKATFTDYTIYLTDKDRAVAAAIMAEVPLPKIVLLEGLAGPTTRGWDPDKVPVLEAAIMDRYQVAPWWFGAANIPYYEGRRLTIRENIALLALCDVGIGVLSGPLHFAAAVGLPTITLYGEQPVERAAPAYFLNKYQPESRRWHRTLLAPSSAHYDFLKPEQVSSILTPAEQAQQGFKNWQQPGRQSHKSCLAMITVEEIMTVLADVLK